MSNFKPLTDADNQYEIVKFPTRSVKCKKLHIPLNKLKFWKDNPRIAEKIEAWKQINKDKNVVLSQETIKEFLKPEYKIELAGFRESKHFAKPAIVALDKEDGNYVVIEGNRRLGAWQDLQAENAGPEFDYFYCQVLPDDATEFEKDSAIIRTHVSGEKGWSAWAKRQKLVNFVFECEERKMTISEITATTGFTEKELKKIKDTHKFQKEYIAFAISKCNVDDEKEVSKVLEDAKNKTTYFAKAVGHPKLCQNYLDIPEHREQFFKCILDKRIKDCLEVDGLLPVLNDPEAREKLYNGSPFSELRLEVRRNSEAKKKDTLSQITKSLTNLIKDLNQKDKNLIRDSKEKAKEKLALTELNVMLTKILN
jgi:hypothetical protein